jgi:hypothetical protein
MDSTTVISAAAVAAAPWTSFEAAGPLMRLAKPTTGSAKDAGLELRKLPGNEGAGLG